MQNSRSNDAAESRIVNAQDDLRTNISDIFVHVIAQLQRTQASDSSKPALSELMRLGHDLVNLHRQDISAELKAQCLSVFKRIGCEAQFRRLMSATQTPSSFALLAVSFDALPPLLCPPLWQTDQYLKGLCSKEATTQEYGMECIPDISPDTDGEEEPSEPTPPTLKKRGRGPGRKKKLAQEAENQQSKPQKRRRILEGDNVPEADKEGNETKANEEPRKRGRKKVVEVWTEEENSALAEQVARFGENTRKWRTIAKEIGSMKNSVKCSHHWRTVLGPTVTHAFWHEDEEQALISATKELGVGHWVDICARIPGKTAPQCGYHYVRQDVSAEIVWTPEEDSLLMAGHECIMSLSVPPQQIWLAVAELIKTAKIRHHSHTALQCKERWTLLRRPKSSSRTK